MARKLSRSQRAEEKRQKRVRMVMAVFIIAIMVLSSLAFIMVFYAPSSDEGYDFDYEVRDDQLLVRTSAGVVPFYNFPDQRYTLPQQTTDLLRDAQSVVLSFDPDDNQTAQYVELVRFDLSQYFEVSGARTHQSNQYAQFPVATCDQSTPGVPVVVFSNQSASSSVNGSCITMGVDGIDVLYARDALLYSYFDLL